MKILYKIYNLAKQLPNRYGETYEKTLCLIAMQESSLGINRIGDISENKPIIKGSFGIFQFQLSTVRFISKKYKKLNWINNKSDWWIINQLVNNDDFSIILAIYYMKWISESKKANKNWARMITMWNGMPNGRVTQYYYKVIRWKYLIYPYLKNVKKKDR